MKYKFFIVLFLIFFVVSFLLRILPSLNYNFPFTTDQGRDMLDIRNIVVGKHLTLIGPTTSVNGVFLGPFWYYFNSVPFAISQGDPQSLVYWMILWFMLAFFSLWSVTKKTSLLFGIVTSLIFLMAPILFFPSRFSWSANPMPFVTIFLFLAMIMYLEKPTRNNSLILGLIMGLGLQIEAAFGILFFPFVLIVSLWKKIPLKFVLFVLLSFVTTLLPQIFFEFRHQFMMTKTFINEFTGKSEILGDKLNPIETFWSHYNDFTNIPHGLFKFPDSFSTIFFFFSTIYLIFRIRFSKVSETIKNYFLVSLFFILFAFTFYLFYPHSLKGWYLLGLNIPYMFIFACFFTEIFKLKNTAFTTLVICLLGFSFYSTFKEQSNYIPKDSNFRSADKSTLKNELTAIDWIYKKANGQAFKVYNYIPSVYDFPYQYLFWWHGLKTYDYLPDTMTYKDNVPEYIPNNNYYLQNKKVADKNSPIFLLYEKDENPIRLYAWLGDFTKLCPIEKMKYFWGTTVELREPCQN